MRNFCKFKDIKELRGGVLVYAAQAIVPIDVEIAEKGHLWTETNYGRRRYRHSVTQVGPQWFDEPESQLRVKSSQPYCNLN